MTTPDQPEEDRIADAGEYVLRLMPYGEHAAFEARLETDPALRDLVTAWETDFAGLTDDLTEIAPRPNLATRVAFSVDGRAPASAQRVADWWRGVSAVAAAVIMGLSFQLYQTSQPDPLGPMRGAALTDGENLMMHALIELGDTDLRITHIAGGPPPNRALELWAIASDAPPVSLGIVPAEGQTIVNLPAEIAAQIDTITFAISDEPLGGSPTGAPTGAILTTSGMTAF